MAEVVKRIKTEKDHGAGPDWAAVEGDRSDGEISVKISSEALSCRICLEPLRPPIFKVIFGQQPADAFGSVICSCT
jgi:hypothetical protein